MWKLILRSSFENFVTNIWKSISRIFVWLFLEFTFMSMILSFGFAIEWENGLGFEMNSMNAMAGVPVSKTIVVAVIIIFLISTGMTAYFIRENPVRIPKMLFLVPADEKTRMRYIQWKFLTRLLWLLGGMMLFHSLTLGGFFYEKKGIPILVQFGIFLFTVWALILKTGIYGIKSKDSLEESSSLQESLANFYWILFLLLQQIFFGIGYMFHIYDKYPAVWLIWLVILALDATAAKYCTSDILRKAASYEQIYARLS